MVQIIVNAEDARPICPDGASALRAAIEAVPPGAPVVIMVHGFRFAPGARAQDNPHRHILAVDPDPAARRALSWPRHLGFAGTRPEAGLAIGFGWPAKSTIWQAYREASRAGVALARLIELIHGWRPDLRLSAIAHSLGARVVLQALGAMATPVELRAILMAAAEFRRPALGALANPAGRRAEIVNVVSRENDLFDFLIERLLPRRADLALGLGLGAGRGNWIDLPLDDEATLGRLGALGFAIAAPQARICHWSLYLRPGVFALYQAILRREIELAALRRAAPAIPGARWSRLLAPREIAFPLPPTQKASV